MALPVFMYRHKSRGGRRIIGDSKDAECEKEVRCLHHRSWPGESLGPKCTAAARRNFEERWYVVAVGPEQKKTEPLDYARVIYLRH